MHYALYFRGNEENDSSWLINKDNRVIIFRVQAVAEKVKAVLYSGDEDIDVLLYTGDLPTAYSEFEDRYLRGWRFQ